MKLNKGNGVVILHRKLYNNAIQEMNSDSSKFKKLNEVPTLKCEASLRPLGKLKQKFLNENECDKSYHSGSASCRIYGTPKMYKFSPSDRFAKLRPIVSYTGTFNHSLVRFLCDFFSPLVPDD